MKKMTKIVSLLLVVVTLFGLTACSSTPDLTVDEMLQKGYAMLDPAGETTKNFTLTINQGEKYTYTFSGRISDGSIMSSLTVSRNGLKSNHKNMFLVNGGKLYVNMNGAMSAAESEIGFTWTDTSAMQNRYLTIDNGQALMKEFGDSLKTEVFADWATTRTATENGKGDHHYNLTYSGDTLHTLMQSLLDKNAAVAAARGEKIDANIKTVTGAAFENFETTMGYYQDKIDIDTEKVTGDYISNGTHFNDLMVQELTALQNLMNLQGSYIMENVSYNADDESESFQHIITFYAEDGSAFGKISLEVSRAEVDKIDPTIYNYLTMEDFVGSMLTNVKNAKGVGYETNDFPYVATYTASQLTLTETNDLYKAVHVFDFTGAAATKYTVTFYTYDEDIHIALQNKYNSMNMQLQQSTTDDLLNGTGSGVLIYKTDSLNSKYGAKDPIELLAQLEKLGVPTYGD
ncbi:MAG: hypothetical protein IJZ68_07095 [Bacteroidaceae bacterium]|nr:hypothetical protein [Bacteroidaceae bacterium]